LDNFSEFKYIKNVISIPPTNLIKNHIQVIKQILYTYIITEQHFNSSSNDFSYNVVDWSSSTIYAVIELKQL
jgi:hypothetical protein